MIYVRRNELGNIVSLSDRALADHPEACPVDHPEVVLFMQRLSSPGAQMLESDLSLIRALEDLIDVLIRKEVLTLTDLPDQVQAKLAARRTLRGSLQSLNLLGDDGDAF